MTDIPEDIIAGPVDPWDCELGDEVRAERLLLLSDSDCYVLPDHPAQRSMETRAALWQYRKALRDLTNNFASPEDVVWPELPEF